MHYFILYKPYGYLSQFTPEGGHQTLGDLYDFPNGVYPVGRLDADSEGLLILTDDKKLNFQLLDPNHLHWRAYWVQVEGSIADEAIKQLEKGVNISLNGTSYLTRPAKARTLKEAPALPERIPPIRYRKNIPTTWIELCLREGKNRQVRRMTAAVGFPTLRLVRSAIENIRIDGLKPGEVREVKREWLMQRILQ